MFRVGVGYIGVVELMEISLPLFVTAEFFGLFDFSQLTAIVGPFKSPL